MISIYILTPVSILSSYLCLRLPNSLAPSNTYLSSPVHLILLYLIILITFREEYKLLSPSLGKHLHPPVTPLSYVQIFSSILNVCVLPLM